MAETSMLARMVALVGYAAIAWRWMQGPTPEQSLGTAPTIPAAKPQGCIPTLKMPTARGWRKGKRSGGLAGNLTYAMLAAVMGSSDCGR